MLPLLFAIIAVLCIGGSIILTIFFFNYGILFLLLSITMIIPLALCFFLECIFYILKRLYFSIRKQNNEEITNSERDSRPQNNSETIYQNYIPMYTLHNDILPPPPAYSAEPELFHIDIISNNTQRNIVRNNFERAPLIQTWKMNCMYQRGNIVEYHGRYYRCRQTHSTAILSELPTRPNFEGVGATRNASLCETRAFDTKI